MLEVEVGEVGVISNQAESNANRIMEVTSDDASKHLICKAIVSAALNGLAWRPMILQNVTIRYCCFVPLLGGSALLP